MMEIGLAPNAAPRSPNFLLILIQAVLTSFNAAIAIANAGHFPAETDINRL